MRVISILVSALFLLAACGTRGPLVLPPKADLVDHSSTSAEAGR
jgi:predicted small lipoprotein YifL